MAPPLWSIPRRSETTTRSASTSSTSLCEESTHDALKHPHHRRFFTMAAILRRQFQPPSSSSGQTEHTTSFPASSRTSDASTSPRFTLSFQIRARPEPSAMAVSPEAFRQSLVQKLLVPFLFTNSQAAQWWVPFISLYRRHLSFFASQGTVSTSWPRSSFPVAGFLSLLLLPG
nr:uncharacterized protein LOC127296117 [Lolium perenne]